MVAPTVGLNTPPANTHEGGGSFQVMEKIQFAAKRL